MGRNKRKTRKASNRKKNRAAGARRNSKSKSVIDISRFNEIEEDLQTYKQLVDSANHSLAFSDVKGNLLYVNDNGARMHGYSARELIGRNLKIFYNGEQMKRIKVEVKRLIKTGKGFSNEVIWHTHRDGRVFPTLMSTWLMNDKHGHPSILCATAVDISELEASKKALETMLNATNDLVVMIDRDGTVLDGNQRMADRLGQSKEDLIGRCLWDFMPPKLAATRRKLTKQVIATGKTIIFTDESKDGIFFSNSFYPLMGPCRKITGVVIFAKDVTQQKKAETELEAGKKTLEAMLNASSDRISLGDRNFNTIELNERMADSFGQPREKIIGRCVWDLMSPKAVAVRRPRAKQVIATGKPITFFTYDSEKEAHTSVSYYPLKGPDGKVTGIVVFVRDITQYKKAEAELEASKKTLEAMLNASGEAIAMLDRDIKFIEVNERMVEAFGIPREKLIGQCAFDSMPPEAIAFRRPKAEHLLATGKPVTYFDEDKGRNYSISGYPLKGADGKVTGIVVFAKDVTEHKMAEVNLEASKKTLETMLNASGEAIAMLDRDMNFIEMNEQMVDAFEQPREKLIGRCAWDCMPPEATALRRPKAAQILATGKPETYFDEDGKGRVYSTTGYPLKGSDGKITGIVVFAKDITQHKKAETELSHYREELLRLRRSTYLDLLSSIIMHQISQPLTIMDMLLDGTLNEIKSGKFEKGKAIGVLETCLRETRSAVGAIQKTREHSRQFTKSRIERFNLGQVIMDVVSTLDLKASHAKMKIEVTDLKSLPVISGYKNALEQIVLNITENAIEAADGKKQHQLAISVTKSDNHIELVFCDDCGGIPRKNLEKIFEPFFSTKVRKGSKCLGLGLPIARRILMAIGGEIRVKSTAGKGTTFYVNWPLS